MNSLSLLRRLALITAIFLVTIAAAGLAHSARTWLLSAGPLGGRTDHAASIVEAPSFPQVGTHGINPAMAPSVVDGPAVGR